MNDQDIVKLFEKFKDDEEFNRPFDVDASWKLVAKRADLSLERPEANYGFRDYLEYYIWQFTHAMVKPVAAAVAVFLLAITGWVSAANLAGSALPGDDLYPLKLGIERVQLGLAFGDDQRAALQVDFASRRLEEMVVVAAIRSEDQAEAIQLAVAQVRAEVGSIQAALTNQEAGDQAATELAKAVDRKTDVYKTTVAGTSDLPEDVQEEVEQIIEDTQEQAVQVIISAHELGEDEETERELSLAFDKELADVTKDLIDVEEEMQEQIDLAIKLKDEGAYRRAFQVLKEIEIRLEE